MKRFFYTLTVLAMVSSCVTPMEEDARDIVPQGSVPVAFGAVDASGMAATKASGVERLFGSDSVFSVVCEDLEPVVGGFSTKVTEVGEANLTRFYVTTTKGSGSESVVLYNTEFTGTQGNTYTATGGMYWPSVDPSYHFYASNVHMKQTADGYNLIDCTNDTDIVYAYNGTPTYKTVNTLNFSHVYGRIKNVTLDLPEGFTGTLASATITCPTTGVFNVRAGEFSDIDEAEELTLAASNDIWVVPGTDYDMSIVYSLSDGSVTRQGLTRYGKVSIAGGKKNNIVVHLADSYQYEFIISPGSAEMNIGDTESFTATLRTILEGSVIDERNVTAASEWTSSNTVAASVSAGSVEALAPGSSTITATYGAHSASATVSVEDPIVSWDNPVVTLVYSPAEISYNGGSVTPEVHFTQVAHHLSGATETFTEESTFPDGSSVDYAFEGDNSSFTVSPYTGKVEVPSFYGDSRSVTVTATVKTHHTPGGESGTATAVVTQGDTPVSWSNPVVTLVYNPSSFGAAGGTATPTLSYEQTVTYASGTERSITTGAAVSYRYSGDEGLSCVLSGADQGKVTATPNSGDSRSITVTVTVTMPHGESGSASVTLTQGADQIESAGPVIVTVEDFGTIVTGGGSWTPVASSTSGNVHATQEVRYTSGEVRVLRFPEDGGTIVWSVEPAAGFTLNNASTGKVSAVSNAGSTTVSYTDPVGSLSYTGSDIPSGGGSYSPVLSYSQDKLEGRSSTAQRQVRLTATVTMEQGKSGSASDYVKQAGDAGAAQQVVETYVSGASVSWSHTASEGFTLNTSNGNVTVGSNVSTNSETTYGNITVKGLSYSEIPAAGGSVLPVITYEQDVTTVGSATAPRGDQVSANVTLNGRTGVITATLSQDGASGTSSSYKRTSGASVSYSFNGAHDGFTSVVSNTGEVTATANLGADTYRYGDYSVTLSYPGNWDDPDFNGSNSFGVYDANRVTYYGCINTTPELSYSYTRYSDRDATSVRQAQVRAQVSFADDPSHTGTLTASVSQEGDAGSTAASGITVTNEGATGIAYSWVTEVDDTVASIDVSTGTINIGGNEGSPIGWVEDFDVEVDYYRDYSPYSVIAKIDGVPEAVRATSGGYSPYVSYSGVWKYYTPEKSARFFRPRVSLDLPGAPSVLTAVAVIKQQGDPGVGSQAAPLSSSFSGNNDNHIGVEFSFSAPSVDGFTLTTSGYSMGYVNTSSNLGANSGATMSNLVIEGFSYGNGNIIDAGGGPFAPSLSYSYDYTSAGRMATTERELPITVTVTMPSYYGNAQASTVYLLRQVGDAGTRTTQRRSSGANVTYSYGGTPSVPTPGFSLNTGSGQLDVEQNDDTQSRSQTVHVQVTAGDAEAEKDVTVTQPAGGSLIIIVE